MTLNYIGTACVSQSDGCFLNHGIKTRLTKKTLLTLHIDRDLKISNTGFFADCSPLCIDPVFRRVFHPQLFIDLSMQMLYNFTVVTSVLVFVLPVFPVLLFMGA